ncbi:MAG: DUF488 family protein [Methylococcales bacterium]
MQLYTIGYGGRYPTDFIHALVEHEVRAVVDVRLRPDRAAMGVYVKAKKPEKGIVNLLNQHNIAYYSILELGNVFLTYSDWAERYQRLLDQSGDLLTAPLQNFLEPFCLLCAERRVEQCHRKQIGDYLARKGWSVQHIE